jgi:hypothetical protein
MLFPEGVGVYCENQSEYTDALCGQKQSYYIKGSGTYSNHWTLTGYFWVLHPVACIVKVIRSAVPRNNLLRCLFIYIWYRYMFRPMLDIFKRNIQL